MATNNKFDYSEHAANNADTLHQIALQSKPGETVRVCNKDGHSVTVNADRKDEGFRLWTSKPGYAVHAEDAVKLEIKKIEKSPELIAAEERAEGFEKALAELSAKFDSFTKQSQATQKVAVK